MFANSIHEAPSLFTDHICFVYWYIYIYIYIYIYMIRLTRKWQSKCLHSFLSYIHQVFHYYHYVVCLPPGFTYLVTNCHKTVRNKYQDTVSFIYITVKLHERSDVPNHQRVDGLFKIVVRITTNETSNPDIIGPLCGQSTDDEWISLTKD